MNIAICEDEILQADLLFEYLKKCEYLDCDYDKIDVFYDANSIMKSIKQEKSYDILFLDIKVGQDNGVRIAHFVKQKNRKAIIFFITNYAQYISYAFLVNAFQYILKPINQDFLYKEIQRALLYYKKIHAVWLLNKTNENVAININDIIYVEGYHRHLQLHTKDKCYDIIGQVGEAEKKLKNFDFIRVHQGFLVNMCYVREISKDGVICTRNISLPVSVRKYRQAIEEYSKFLLK